MYFVQILGIAMGSVCGPTIANIFVNFFEKKWFNIQRPLYYKRFIDDLLVLLMMVILILNFLILLLTLLN